MTNIALAFIVAVGYLATAGSTAAFAQREVIYRSPQQAETRRSTDGGRSWTVDSPRHQSGSAPADTRRVLAFHGKSVLHSTDGGRSWRKVSESPSHTAEAPPSQQSFLNVFPVPFQDVLYVQVDSPGSDIEVYSVHGVRVLAAHGSERQGGLCTLDFDGLPAGTYILVMTNRSVGSVFSTIITKQ